MRVRIHLSTLDLTLFCYVFYLIWFMYLFLKCVLYSFLLKLCISEAWKISTKHLAYMNYVLGGYFSFFSRFYDVVIAACLFRTFPFFLFKSKVVLRVFLDLREETVVRLGKIQFNGWTIFLFHLYFTTFLFSFWIVTAVSPGQCLIRCKDHCKVSFTTFYESP